MLHIYTYSTSPEKVQFLERSAELHSLPIRNLSKTTTWTGFQDRIDAFHAELATLPDTDLFCFVDAYDVIANADIKQIQTTFETFQMPLVFSAETMLYPFSLDKSTYPTSPTPFRFLNAGCFIGTVKAVKEMYAWTKAHLAGKRVSSGEEDQGLYQAYFLANQDKIKLDVHANLFLNMNQVPWNTLTIEKGQIHFAPFQRTPCFFHFNGMSYLDNDHDFIDVGDNKRAFTYDKVYSRTFTALIGAKFISEKSPVRLQLTGKGHTYP
jgi:hypothetical protein